MGDRGNFKGFYETKGQGIVVRSARGLCRLSCLLLGVPLGIVFLSFAIRVSRLSRALRFSPSFHAPFVFFLSLSTAACALFILFFFLLLVRLCLSACLAAVCI